MCQKNLFSIFVLIVLVLTASACIFDTPPFSFNYSIETQFTLMKNRWHNAVNGWRGRALEIPPGELTIGGHIHNQDSIKPPRKIRVGYGVYDFNGHLMKDLGYWSGTTKVKSNGNIMEKTFDLDWTYIPENYYWGTFIQPVGRNIPEGSSVNLDVSFVPDLYKPSNKYFRISTGKNTRATDVKVNPKFEDGTMWMLNNQGKYGGVLFKGLYAGNYPITIDYEMLDYPGVFKEITYEVIIDGSNHRALRETPLPLEGR